MMGHRSGVVKQIREIQLKALETNCHSHALSLSVKDMTNQSKLLSDVISTVGKKTVLVKYSLKREELLWSIQSNIEGGKNGESLGQPTIQQIFVGLKDVFKKSSRHVLRTSSTRLQRNNFKSSKTCWRRLEDFLKISYKTSSRCLQDVMEDEKLLHWRRLRDMSRRRLEDMYWRRLEDISWRCPEDMSWWRLEDIMETNKIVAGVISILIWG